MPSHRWIAGATALLGLLGLDARRSSAQEPTFHLELTSPRSVVPGLAGEETRFPVRCRLRTEGLRPGGRGAQGWSLGVASRGECRIAEATVSGTAGASSRRGGYEDGGFHKTEITLGEGNEGVVSAVVLSTSDDVVLPVTGSPHDVLAMTVLATPQPGGRCIPCDLRIVDGLQGSGQPVPNVVTWEERSFTPTLGSLRVDVCPVTCFRPEPTPDWPTWPVGDLAGAARPLDELRATGYEICSASRGHGPLEDNFLFLAQTAQSDFEVEATLVDVGESGEAGLDARADLGTFPDRRAPYVAITVLRTEGGGFELRSHVREAMGEKARLDLVDSASVDLPIRLRITQTSRGMVTAYSMDGGKTWMDHLDTEGVATLPPTALYRVGMAQASRRDSSSTALFREPSLRVQRSVILPRVTKVAPLIAPVNVPVEVQVEGEGLGAIEEIIVAGQPAEILDIGESLVRFRTPVVDGPVRGSILILTRFGNLQLREPFVFLGEGYIRCDCNGDGRHDVSDSIAWLNYLFLGAPNCRCPDAGDCNGDGNGDLSDAIAGLAHLFLGGAQPPPPYPTPGVGDSPALACAPDTPRISKISASEIRPGDVVTIEGAGFAPDPGRYRVYFGENPAQVVEATTRSLQVQVGDIVAEATVSPLIIDTLIDDLTIGFPCREFRCLPFIVGPALPSDILDGIRLRPSEALASIGQSRREDGAVVLQLDPRVFDGRRAGREPLTVQMHSAFFLPAVQGASRGSVAVDFEQDLPAGSSFEEAVELIAGRLRKEISPLGTPGELMVLSDGKTGEIRIRPRADIERALTLAGLDFFGGLGGYIPGFGRPPAGRCGPDDLEPILDERAFGWCRVEENVRLCAGRPLFEYWVPADLVVQESGDIFPLAHPDSLSPFQKSVAYNRSAYCHVRKHALWNRCELEDLVLDGHTQVPHFPRSAIVSKTSWRTASELPAGANLSEYYSYTHSGSGITYYLTALHFTTKDIDKWFWLDLYMPESKNGPGGCGGANSDVPASLAGTVWANYYLCTNVTEEQDLASFCGNFEFCPECPDIYDGACGGETCLSCHERATKSTPSGPIDLDFLYSLQSAFPSPNPCP